MTKKEQLCLRNILDVVGIERDRLREPKLQ